MTILVIGTGAIGKRHSSNLQALGEQVVNISYSKTGLSGVQQQIENQSFEAAILCTATQIRNEVIELLAAANLPVYIEKPVAFRSDDLGHAYRHLGNLSQRSYVGYMMRYHPALQWLADQNLSDIYRFDFVIGHDVNQWRDNWSFKDSYASNPEGGGVLLDLCHELDMASVAFPDCKITDVTSSDHIDFTNVDFASKISLQSETTHGTVSMDYLSPVSTRTFRAFGTNKVIIFNFAKDSYQVDTGNGPKELPLNIDRQDMFKAAMSDFLRTARGQISENPIAPILETERKSCEFICDAYESRQFKGKIGS